MPENLYCLSVINNAGYMLAGFSPDGAGNWSHFQTSTDAEPPTPGFVEIERLATSRSPSVASFSSSDGPMVMAFLGHSDNNIYYAVSGDGTSWSENRITGFNSDNPPAIFVMPYEPNLMLAFTEPQTNEIIIATAAEGGAPWTRHAIGHTASSAPAVLYTADITGGSWSQTNFYFLMIYQANDGSNNILIATSSDGINWQPGPGTGQQSQAAPSLCWALRGDSGDNYTMAFLANDFSNQILLSSSVNGLEWSPVVGTGHHCRGTPQLTRGDGVLCLVYLGLGDDHIYCCRSTDGVHWSETQVCPGLMPPGATRMSVQPPPTLSQPLPLHRDGGLGDNLNYYFYDGGRPLRNVRVEVIVTEDIIMPPYTATSEGISFQVNCYSPGDATTPKVISYIAGWQQYDTHVTIGKAGTTNLYFRIDNWPQTKLQGFSGVMLGLSSPSPALPHPYLPRDSRLVTTLHNDADDNVTGVTFAAYYPDGSEVQSWSKQLVGQINSNKTPLLPQDISPILAFQVDFVARRGKVILTGGAGIIKCSAWNLMTVEGSRPSTCVGPPTGESANSTYSILNNQPSTVFTQTFGVRS